MSTVQVLYLCNSKYKIVCCNYATPLATGRRRRVVLWASFSASVSSAARFISSSDHRSPVRRGEICRAMRLGTAGTPIATRTGAARVSRGIFFDGHEFRAMRRHETARRGSRAREAPASLCGWRLGRAARVHRLTASLDSRDRALLTAGGRASPCSRSALSCGCVELSKARTIRRSAEARRARR